jgi:hypothetical protein
MVPAPRGSCVTHLDANSAHRGFVDFHRKTQALQHRRVKFLRAVRSEVHSASGDGPGSYSRNNNTGGRKETVGSVPPLARRAARRTHHIIKQQAALLELHELVPQRALV